MNQVLYVTYDLHSCILSKDVVLAVQYSKGRLQKKISKMSDIGHLFF